MPWQEAAHSWKLALTVAGSSILVGYGELWVWMGEVWAHLPSAEGYAQFWGGSLAAATVIYKTIDFWRDEAHKKRLKKVEEREAMLDLEYRSGRHFWHDKLAKPPNKSD